jgi:hypothetical protein
LGGVVLVLFDLDSKSILKWLWKQIQMRKEKKKNLPAAQRLGGLPELTCPFLSSLLGRRVEPVSSASLLRPRGPAQEAATAARLPSLLH